MGRVAVITGGSAGIGLATADLMARRGWSVAILAREEGRLDQAAERLRRHGSAVLTISADVADAGAVDQAAARVERELGPIAAWVNNAMSTVVAPADEITPEEYARVTATTYLGQVHGTLAALRHMKQRGRGSIVQVSSGLGFRAAPLQAAYCAAKFAVSGFTDALRAELVADDLHGIGLSVIYLPAVNTPQFGWARNRTGHEQNAPDPVYDPRLCAEAIAFAAERPRREIWVGNSVVVMGVAQSLVPSYADRKVAGFREAQLGAPGADKRGNLDEPVAGPAAVDGRFTDRVKGTRTQFYTSRQRDAAKLGGLAALAAAAITGIVVAARRR